MLVEFPPPACTLIVVVGAPHTVALAFLVVVGVLTISVVANFAATKLTITKFVLLFICK